MMQHHLFTHLRTSGVMCHLLSFRFLAPTALKVVLVCFERSLGNQWYRLSLQVKEMALRKVGGLAFWDFIDFIVRARIPIFVLLRPFIQCKVKHQRQTSFICFERSHVLTIFHQFV